MQQFWLVMKTCRRISHELNELNELNSFNSLNSWLILPLLEHSSR